MQYFTANDARAWAEIDLGALIHNYEYTKSIGKRVMCVLKANAYGHGALRCAAALSAHGADTFAVACIDEAMELRAGGIETPILNLGYVSPEYVQILVDRNIVQTAVDEEHTLALNDAACSLGTRLPVHIKVDTGMSRAGIFAHDDSAVDATAEFIRRASGLPGLDVQGVYTHLASADDAGEDTFTERQLARFEALLNKLEGWGCKPPLCHAGNSAAAMRHPGSHLNMVRAGVMLYGMYPDSIPREDGPLVPVMTLRARITQVKDVPAGASISYGRTYHTTRPTKMAIVPIGYADGYPRRLSNRAYSVINGYKCPEIGTVCMDMHMVDVTDAPGVKRGDEAIVIGNGGMSMEEAANIVGTINYELTCLITPRLERVYIDD